MTRRMTSGKVALTAAFLALAAGGTAACDTSYSDSSSGDDMDFSRTTYGPGSGTGSYDSGSSVSDYAEPVDEEPADEVFYCADEDGEIVDEENCDDDSAGSTFFLWHSPFYDHGLTRGTVLDGGDYFAAGDREARRAFKLPATGKVTNGTVKTNVVGRGSGGYGLGGTSGG